MDTATVVQDHTDARLDLKVVEEALAGNAAAFRAVTRLQPAGGPADKVFPPTYEGGRYAVEERVVEGRRVSCVVLDSVQSQANRMELALLDALRDGRISLPLVEVTFDHQSLMKKLVVTSFEAPHRLADAIFRDCLLDGSMFRESNIGRTLHHADIRNATGLFGVCPTALLFGLWDSTGPRGGLGAKFQRAIVSEIVGIDAQAGVKTSSRIDPLQVMLGAGPLYKRRDQTSDAPTWTLDERLAYSDKKGSAKLGKDGKPSEANHGNVTPSIAPGGFTVDHALQTTVISLPAIRRLRFPLDGGPASDPAVDQAARVVLAAMGLLAATLSLEKGLDLRSRCLLVPVDDTRWELLGPPWVRTRRFSLDSSTAVEVFNQALAKALAAGLPWNDQPIKLTPSDELVRLVARSQELAASSAAEEE